MAETPRVVIVGGGFGGLSAAQSLARAPVRVTVIDRHNYHLFRPMLYQVATGLLSADEIAAPIRSLLRRQRNADVLLAEVTGIDIGTRHVLAGDQSIPYDFLILATGIEYSYFGHAAWAAVAPSITTADDAARMRARLLSAFEEAERAAVQPHADPAVVQALLTIVIVGGGTTGVELAGAVAELAHASLAGDFRHIDTRRTRIILFEGGPRILPSFPAALAARAQRHLQRMGVEVRTGALVSAVDDDGVTVGTDERVPSRTVLWAAGVTASPAGRWLGADVDRAGKVRVLPDLSVPGHPEIFVIGDTATLTASSRNLVGMRNAAPMTLPGVAQPAIQEGRYVGALIARRLRGRPAPPPFSYWDKGDVAIVGRTFAIADLKFMRLSGFLGLLLWAGVHIYYLIDFANRLLVIMQWTLSFLGNRRHVRIFSSTSQRA
ncbi:MAG TPA: NAD(P)/FAD-dependent oxidoreductase [Gemmatimonadaceae bacterium]|nr:NAD(P)/FAD-dependent oxidoreductase [Gemmatimonadaceae bacterium]